MNHCFQKGLNPLNLSRHRGSTKDKERGGIALVHCGTTKDAQFDIGKIFHTNPIPHTKKNKNFGPLFDGKYRVTGDPIFTGCATQPNFGPENRLKRR